ncbi:Ribonuclease R, partial [Haemophilus influenzae]
AFS